MLSAFGERPANGSATWTPESRHRGTWTILSTCLTTMLLCIWTAIHLNIPQQRRAIKNFFRKGTWVIIGILAPELIVWSAFQQRKDAKHLTKRIRKLLGQADSPSLWQSMKNKLKDLILIPEIWWIDPKSESEFKQGGSNPEWTDVQSFYVLMGGYVLADDQDYLSIKPQGVERLLKPGNDRLTILSTQSVLDKSKANGLAKFLVCLQAGWFCMQCVGRLATGLPICLLELNTFAHAICAILIYVLWWDKPFDIEQPTFVKSDNLIRPISYLIDRDGKTRWIGRHLENLGYGEGRVLPVTFRLSRNQHARPGGIEGVRIMNPSMTASGNTRIEFRIQGFERDDTFVVTSRPTTCHFHGFDIYIQDSDSYLELTKQDLDELQAVSNYFAQHGREHIEQSFGVGVASNWPGWASSNPAGIFCAPLEFGAASMLVGFSVAGVLYGAIHLLAWDAPFRTSLELILWRTSGCILISSGLFIPFVDMSSGMINDSEDSVIARLGCGALRPVFYIVFIFVSMPITAAFMIGYVLARVYLFVECFRSLTYLPESVFVMPNWSTYIPHFG